MDVKIQKIREFIEDGDKVKTGFRGPGNGSKDNGFAIVTNFQKKLKMQNGNQIPLSKRLIGVLKRAK